MSYESYPPSLWFATGATAGTPGTWGSGVAPRNVAELISGYPNTFTADPDTPWAPGEYVQTRTPGVDGQASWDGTDWVPGPVPEAPEGFAMGMTEPDPELTPESDDPEEVTDEPPS